MRIVIDTDVVVLAPDGVELRADVYRPENGVHPALVHRTPYGKGLDRSDFYRVGRLVAGGYAVIVQDTRGRFASAGRFTGLTPEMWAVEGRDTYGTVEWAARQPWCDGAVGMFGASFAGALCWLGAMARPPHLRAVVPMLIGDRETAHLDTGGAFWLHTWVSWYLSAAGADKGCASVVEHLPVAQCPLFDRPEIPVTLKEILHGDAAGTPPAFAAERVAVPMLLVGGWYDFYAARMIDQFHRLRESSAERVRGEHRLVMGPWTHDSAGPVQGELNFGAVSAGLGVVQPAMLSFFDRHLKGRGTDSPADSAPVRYFVPGESRWRDAESWPPTGAGTRVWYLHAGGALTDARPTLDEPPDTYRYDPADPVRTLGGRVAGNISARGPAGPRDQRILADRADTLAYTTPALDRPLVLAGHATVHAFTSTSAVDTDFCARLVDIHPDGRAMLITAGLARARYRKGADREVLVEPGAIEEYEICLGPLAYRLDRGHRLGVLVCSSDFPWFDRNMNTGRALGTDATPVVARQAIFHDPAHPSRLQIHTTAPEGPAVTGSGE